MSEEKYINHWLDMINRNSLYGIPDAEYLYTLRYNIMEVTMKKVCEDCTHNRYCGGEYVDEKGCFYKHYYNKDGKYVMSAEKKEDKEMGVMFDQYIKNVDAIDVEFLPDESQIKLKVRSGENIHLFLLEGEGIKIAAENYVNMEYASLLEKYKEQEAKIELKNIMLY